MSDLSIHRYDFEEVHLSTVEASGQVIAKDTWTHQLPNVYDILNGVSHKFVNPSKGQAMHGYWFPLLFVAHMSLGGVTQKLDLSGGQTTSIQSGISVCL